jgi:small glutamine-rich tetratricopeptide repeat-containing protein alpha
MNDEAQKSQLSVKPANLTQIFDVYLKTEAKRGSTSKPPASATASSSAATSAVRRLIYKHI